MYIDVTARRDDWREIYRLCISFINPRPIALVSTLGADGARNLAPFSFYNMVAANPPVVILGTGLHRDRRPKDTYVNIRDTREFVIATVTAEIARPMVAAATELPYGTSEWERAGLTPAPATRVRPALVRESPVNIECTLRKVETLGDGPGSAHVVFGDVVAIHVADELLGADGAIDPRRLRTVGRLGGKWYCTVTEPYEMEIPPA
ncbi:MAG: flavin reductase family protein [Phycisphaerae bacterium]